jgi:hypothetical protein
MQPRVTGATHSGRDPRFDHNMSGIGGNGAFGAVPLIGAAHAS